MIIGLHDAEKDHMKNKSFPNYALMKLSAYHKAKGDEVVWWMPGKHYDVVYSSKVFDFTPENPYLPPNTIKGGTGYSFSDDLSKGIFSSLADDVDAMLPDYAIYPDCDFAIGYLTRGCIRACRWCCVYAKEGYIKPYRNLVDVLRPDSNKLVLMDNNILACDHGIEQLELLALYNEGTGCRHDKHKHDHDRQKQAEHNPFANIKLDLNQGIDARLVDNRIAEILTKIKWIKYIRFSCDSKEQIDSVINAAEMLISLGTAPSKIFVYLLVTQDVADAAYRVEQLKRLKSITIYAQPERNSRMGIPPPNAEQKEFCQRYIYGGAWRKESWEDYCEKRKSYSKRRYIGT